MNSLNFQVHPFDGDELSKKDLGPLLAMLATVDSAVIGPGLSRTPAALTLIRELIKAAPCPLVLDASALQPWTLTAAAGKIAVVTLHLGELERMGLAPGQMRDAATAHDLVIHLKGRVDRIATPGKPVKEIEGGNAGLTVGGTGDALAGLIAGFMAQGNSPFDSCVTAGTVIKRAGEVLSETRGFAYTTRDVIAEISQVLRSLI